MKKKKNKKATSQEKHILIIQGSGIMAGISRPKFIKTEKGLSGNAFAEILAELTRKDGKVKSKKK